MVDRDGCELCTRRVHADCVDELERLGDVCERRMGDRHYASLIVNGVRQHSSDGCDSCCDAISDLLMRVRKAKAEQRGPEHSGGA
jgi:hypothetical protein